MYQQYSSSSSCWVCLAFWWLQRPLERLKALVQPSTPQQQDWMSSILVWGCSWFFFHFLLVLKVLMIWRWDWLYWNILSWLSASSPSRWFLGLGQTLLSTLNCWMGEDDPEMDYSPLECSSLSLSACSLPFSSFSLISSLPFSSISLTWSFTYSWMVWNLGCCLSSCFSLSFLFCCSISYLSSIPCVIGLDSSSQGGSGFKSGSDCGSNWSNFEEWASCSCWLQRWRAVWQLGQWQRGCIRQIIMRIR